MEEKNKIKPFISFATNSISVIGQYTVRPRYIQRQQLRTMMVNPYLNWEGLQGISSLLIANNGDYQRLVKYFGSMARFDHILYPLATNGKVVQKNNNFEKSYLEASQLVQKMNLRHNCRWWANRLIEQGELFLYKIEDNSGIVYQEIPSFICRANRVENGVIRYQIDLARIDLYLLATLPLEIQNMYQKKSDGLFEFNWYDVSNNGVAFNIWGNSLPHGIPYLSFLFDKLLLVEDFEDMNEDLTKVDNLKIIHQTIPTNDQGEVLMDEDLVATYHNATKKNLPKGVTITTNPLAMESLSLQSNGNENARGLNYLNSAQASVYNSAGVNVGLFNGDTTNSVLLQAGIVADEQIAIDMLLMFENYINVDLAKRKIAGTTWQIKMFDTTCFNREMRIADARANLSLGGSKMEFLSISGFTPLESYQVLKTEQLLGFNDMFMPVQTSYTMTNSEDSRESDTQEQQEEKKIQSNEQQDTVSLDKEDQKVSQQLLEATDGIE